MSKSIKSFMAVSVLALVAACGGNQSSGDVEEFVVVDPAPISVEPTFSGKYN